MDARILLLLAVLECLAYCVMRIALVFASDDTIEMERQLNRRSN